MKEQDGIVKVLTFKSGNFPFSRRFDEKAVGDKLLEALAIYRTVEELPILPDQAAELQAEVIRRSIFSTAAIEGNPLSEQQAAEIYDSKDPVRAKDRPAREIMNLKAAYARALTPGRAKPGVFRVTEALVREYNKLITSGIDQPMHTPGAYRNHRVEVGDAAHGGVYRPPRILKDIEALMAAFAGWIENAPVKALGEVIRAALAHYHLALIHPFGDGNGRTARLVEAAMISASGLRYLPVMLCNFYYRRMDDYYVAFRESQKSKTHDITPFMALFADGLNACALELKDRVRGFIRRLTLKAHYDALRGGKRLNERQYGLLTLLLATDLHFKLTDLRFDARFGGLYRNVTEQTARRDLKKLEDMGLLKQKNGEYELDFSVL